jgi:aspartyl/asparaginyl-tRNA synthetase
MYTPISAIVAGEAPAELVVTGFVDTLRDHKKFAFVILRQGTDFVQVFVDKEKFPSLDLSLESFVEVAGTLTARPEVGLHGVEIAADRMTVLSSPLDKLPISHKGDGYPSLSERLDHRHLSLREPRIRLVFEAMSSFDFLVREFCRGRGFMEIHTPKIIGTASE